MRVVVCAIGLQMLATSPVMPSRPAPTPWPQAATPSAGLRIGPPIVAVWYRGSPAGTPRREDLADIRARGFDGIVWPSRQTAGTADAARLAADLGLQVTLRIDPVPLTAALARTPGAVVDIAATTRAEEVAALAWRAVAHGAEVVSFDPGVTSGTGFEDSRGRPRPWVVPAHELAAQCAAHTQLLTEWRPVAQVAIDAPAPDAVDLFLLEDARSWILVVTNASRTRARGVAHLPSGVPAALWVDLLDGSLLSMIAQPAGARWSFDLEPGAARVYVVTK